jgi:lipoate-protein ligase A
VKYLELTFADGEKNLACDEALLDYCESGEADGLLRTWEPTNYFIVLGYSNKMAVEVDLAACKRLAIPVFRRFSGGGTVLQGPGCLNYTLVVSNALMGSIPEAYDFVLRRHETCLSELLGMEVAVRGGSDLALSDRKISGNAQHRKRHFTLMHGTFLLNLNLSVMEQALPLPSKKPDYRQNRSHSDFLMNLSITAGSLKRGLRDVWNAKEELTDFPHESVARLLQERYSRSEWNMRF